MLNNIGRTPAFKALLLDKNDVKKLPENLREELKPGNLTSRYSLSPCIFDKFKVEDGDKKYFIGSNVLAKKLEGKLVLDAMKPKFAVQDNKVVSKPKSNTEKLLKQEFYNNYKVVLSILKDENIMNADDVVEL